MTRPPTSPRMALRALLAVCIVCILVCILAPPAARAEEERGGEIGFVGGIVASDEDLEETEEEPEGVAEE